MRVALVVVLTGLVVPDAAAGHAVIDFRNGRLNFVSEDAPSASRLEVTANVLSISVYDPGTVGGIQAPGQCNPGRTDSRGDIVEWTCPATNVRGLDIDLGPNEDRATITSTMPVRFVGGTGADTVGLSTGAATELFGGPGNDVLNGGAGADVVEGGPGSDEIAGGAGDDLVRIAEGERDRAACGDGADRVDADLTDEIDASCEVALREAVAPPGQSTEGDTFEPTLTVRAPSRARAAASVTVRAQASEDGTVAASGYLAVDGRNIRLRTATVPVSAGASARVALRLTKSQLSRVRRALRRGRRASVRMDLVATDRAGNSSLTRSVRIRLRR